MKVYARGLTGMLVLTLLVSTIGCVTQKKFDKLKAENHTLDQRNRELAAQLADKEAQLADLLQKIASGETDAASATVEIAKLKAQIAALVEELNKPIPAGGRLPKDLLDKLKILQTEDGLIDDIEGAKVRLKGDVLFASGKADVKAAAKAQLAKIGGAIVEKGAQFIVRVDGHTDSDPIKVSKWKGNWHLSYARARAVLAELAGAGIPEDRMFIAAFGETAPRVANDSAANKQKNRRVELMLVLSK